MKILFIGDIFGKAGREVVKKYLPLVQEEHSVDFVIANAENMSHGSGFTPEHIKEMSAAGVDFFTTGNHVFSKSKGVEKLGQPDFPVIRPANYPDDPRVPGEGYRIVEDSHGRKICIINLMGRVFTKRQWDCPFKKADQILEEISNEDLVAIIVDFHAETTAEKTALGFYLDGRVSAVLGTHTHVPTADLRVLEQGTAFMCDVGLSGPLDSIIGKETEPIIQSFLTQMRVKSEPVTTGTMVFSAVLLELDEKTKKILTTTHVQY